MLMSHNQGFFNCLFLFHFKFLVEEGYKAVAPIE
jgi:hypothetical protein